MLSKLFHALNREAHFTRDVLAVGATEIRKATYASKGTYFVAFTALATGLERMGKLCLILDSSILDKASPTPHRVRTFRHNISGLYTATTEIVLSRSISPTHLADLNDELHQSILRCLTSFAEGDRYANIDLLSGRPNTNDSIAMWAEQVDQLIAERLVPKKRKDQINERARVISQVLGSHSMVLHVSEEGQDITDLEVASRLTGLNEAIAPIRQLLVMQIIRYWVEVLVELQYMAMKSGNDDIPYLAEVFAIFLNSDQYIKTRKTWTRL